MYIVCVHVHVCAASLHTHSTCTCMYLRQGQNKSVDSSLSGCPLGARGRRTRFPSSSRQVLPVHHYNIMQSHTTEQALQRVAYVMVSDTNSTRAQEHSMITMKPLAAYSKRVWRESQMKTTQLMERFMTLLPVC